MLVFSNLSMHSLVLVNNTNPYIIFWTWILFFLRLNLVRIVCLRGFFYYLLFFLQKCASLFFVVFITIKHALLLQPMFEQYRKWTKQYGKTYGYFEGPSPVIVTSDKDILSEVFVKQFKSFHARKVSSFANEEHMRNK